MGLFSRKYESMEAGHTVENPADDFKTAVRVGQFRISKQAIYKPDGSYLPLNLVIDTVQDRSSVHVSGCCAGGTYVERIILITEGGKYPFLFDSMKEIEKVYSLLK